MTHVTRKVEGRRPVLKTPLTTAHYRFLRPKLLWPKCRKTPNPRCCTWIQRGVGLRELGRELALMVWFGKQAPHVGKQARFEHTCGTLLRIETAKSENVENVKPTNARSLRRAAGIYQCQAPLPRCRAPSLLCRYAGQGEALDAICMLEWR